MDRKDFILDPDGDGTRGQGDRVGQCHPGDVILEFGPEGDDGRINYRQRPRVKGDIGDMEGGADDFAHQPGNIAEKTADNGQASGRRGAAVADKHIGGEVGNQRTGDYPQGQVEQVELP